MGDKSLPLDTLEVMSRDPTVLLEEVERGVGSGDSTPIISVSLMTIFGWEAEVDLSDASKPESLLT